MFDDNWGCVDPSELFTSSGKTQSLNYLVEKLQQAPSAYENIINADRQFPIASTSSADSSVDVKIITPSTNGFDSSSSAQDAAFRPSAARKILKQKRGLVERPPNLKKVTFEVERFVVDNMENVSERQSAETRMAIRLGAIPAKRTATNYKSVVAERKATRLADAETKALEIDQMPVLHALNKLSKKVDKKAAAKRKSKRNK